MFLRALLQFGFAEQKGVYRICSVHLDWMLAHEAPTTDVRQVYAHIGAAVARLHRALATCPGHIGSWTMTLPHTVFEEAVPRIRRALTDQDAEAFRRRVADLRQEMSSALDDLPM